MKQSLLAMVIIAALILGSAPQAVLAAGETTLNVADWSATTTLANISGRPTVLYDNGTYHMWHSYNSDMTLYYTTSTDPTNFALGTQATFPDATEVSSPAILLENGTFYMVKYADATAKVFAMYTSTDGINWADAGVVYDGTGLETFDAGWLKFDAPYLLKDGDTYKLYFQMKGSATGTPYYIFMAETAATTLAAIADANDDIDFSLANGNQPVLSPGDVLGAEYRLMHPMVVKEGSSYYMWYTGHGSYPTEGRVFFASSADGIQWVKGRGLEVIDATESPMSAEPTVVNTGAGWHMWYLSNSAAIKHVSASGPFQFSTIQAAVNAATAGDTINVAPGTYLEEVNLNKAGLHLMGAGYETTTIMGRKDAGGSNTLTLAASDLLVDGFTITRDGNNATDWDANVKNQGVIFNQGTTGSTLQNCRVTGNRNGVYLNNTQNQTVRNNIITNNRTGMQLVNNVTGLVVSENEITNNWTMGVLFCFNTGSYTTSLDITNNNISGNWYGEIQNRWAVDNGVMNVSGNWFGNTEITTSTENSSEPGYAAQIPVEFGGTATPPSTPVAIIGGVQSAMVDYSPWLASGTDTEAGEIGFQGDTTTLFVDDVTQAPGTTSAIQEAIDLAPAGGTINVYPGDYSESATNRTVLDLGGVYQFGLFFGADKSGITVQGVGADGAVITDYANVVANVTTNATNNFGPSGVFVEGDDVTLSGVRVLPNVGGDNKTIEVIGDNFSLEASVIDVAGGGSVYLNDWRFDNDANESYLQSYTILNNLFAQGASLDIASGAGYTGPVSGRVIQGNRFEYSADTYWPAISFSGNSVVPWFTDPVNGATITSNTFVGTTQHIRARGGYDNATFDWLGYRANNTFEKTVVAFVGNTDEVRAYEYETSYGTMTNVRRLTASIQFGVDDAIDGDMVDVSAGTYPEQVTISKDILLQGADGASIIQAYASMPVCFTTSYAHRPIVCVKDTANATIQGFTIDGLGLGNTNNRFVGIAFRNAGGTIQNNTVQDIRDTPFSGAQHGVGIYVYNDDAVARTIHVLDNTVTGFQKTGIALNGSATNLLTVDVQRNIVTGAGATTVTAQNGIQVWAEAGSGVVADNTVSGIAYDNTDSVTKYVATSILNYYTDLSTTGNTITGAHMGIYYYEGRGLIENNTLTIEKIGVYAYGINAADPPQAVPSPYSETPGEFASALAVDPVTAVNEVEITGNTLTFSGTDKTATYGIEADGGYGANDLSVNIHHNSVNGFDNGLVLYQCGTDCGAGVFTAISAVSNNLTDNTVGIYLGGNIPATLSPVIHHNRVYSTGDTDSGLFSDLATSITAENNWWGCNAGPADDACTAVTGLVDAEPWLVLTLNADQDQLVAGGTINLVASLTQNSQGDDTAASGYVMDGIPVEFATTYGALTPVSATLVNGAANFTLDVPDPITVSGATVSATLDGQTVEVNFNGIRYLFLPFISR